jgi:hypothetical protein
MKTRILLISLALRAVLAAAPPPVTLSIDPTEPLNANVVYTRVAAVSEAAGDTAKLWFSVSITNTGGASVRVNNIRATLNTGEVWDFPQSPTVTIAADSTKTITLTNAQIITLPKPVPPLLTIGVYCDTFTDPRTAQRFLIPYTPETAGNRYLVPMDEGDLGPNEYFCPSNFHEIPEGQRWGADWIVNRIKSTGGYTNLREDTNGSQNAHHLGYGIPIRAIANGVVLRVNDGWLDSPVTGTRALQELEAFDGEAISDVKVKYLGRLTIASKEHRFAVIVRRADGQFAVTIWDVASSGRVLLQRGSITSGFTVSHIAIEALSSTRFVVSVRVSGNNAHRLLLYDVPDAPEGQPAFVDDWEGGGGSYQELSLAKLSASAFASSVREADGDLRVEVFTVVNNTISPGTPQAETGGTFIGTTFLGAQGDGDLRFVTSMRTNAGTLKMITWDWRPATSALFRLDDELGASISRVAATGNAGGKWITAVRTSPGNNLQIARWSTAAAGTILAPEMTTTTEHTIQNTALDIVHGTGATSGQVNAATASVIDGDLKMNGWGDHGEATFGADSYNTEATFPITHVSIDEGASVVFLVGARTAAGNLRLGTWFWAQGGGNFAIIRHGKCRFLYAHLKTGSVNEGGLKAGDTVAAGQFIGRMGNTGSAGTPHTHIHGERLEDAYADGSADSTLIVLENLFEYTGDSSFIPTLTARPIPFSEARAMKLANIVRGGELSNDFATMDGHNVFESSSLGIRPRLNTRYVDPLAGSEAANGRKEPASNGNGGPYATVLPAIGTVPSGGRLYIRGKSYNETVTFSTPMTVRRYDFFDRDDDPATDGPVVIGK